jgi:hypothetical protein
MSDTAGLKSPSVAAPTESRPQSNDIASIDAKDATGTTNTSNGIETSEGLKEPSKPGNEEGKHTC